MWWEQLTTPNPYRLPSSANLEQLRQADNTDKSQKGHVDADGASSIVVITAGGVAGTTVLALVGLLVVAPALVATLDSTLLLEVVEEVAEVGNIGSRLNVDGSLDILEARKLDPGSCQQNIN